MDKSFIEQAKDKLAKRRLELTKKRESSASVEDNSAPDSKIKDSADEAQIASMQMLQEAIENSGMAEIRSIDRALARIEAQSYGLCLDCKSPIAKIRLEFFPYAERCVPCQQKYEN